LHALKQVNLIRLKTAKGTARGVDLCAECVWRSSLEAHDDVDVTKADAEPEVWVKVTPTTPLMPGEYAIVYMPADVGLTPGLVYDFAVGAKSAE
jgi:hypothetical protein